MQTTAIIIPAYNEEARIESVLQAVAKNFPYVVVVDDGSRDQTRQIAEEYTVHVLSHPVNIGKGGAMRTGAEYALYTLGLEKIIFIDGDGQHNPNELQFFFDAFGERHDVVFGVRDIWQKMPRSRSIGNYLVSRYVQSRYKVFVPDILSGFKGFTRVGYEQVQWTARGYEVELEIAVRVAQKKIPFASVPIETIYHDFERGMNVLDALRLIGKLPL